MAVSNPAIILIPADPEHRDNVSDIPNKTEERFDWPNDLIDRIKQVMGSSCSTPLGPGMEFRPPDVLRSIFGLHPLWNRMENILKSALEITRVHHQNPTS
jgi:hypothetical protein